MHLALLGDKMNFPRGVGKCNMSQVKHYGVVTMEHITLAIDPQARLPFDEDIIITTVQMVGLIVQNDGSMDTTSVVSLLELEEVRTQTSLLSLKCHHIGPKHRP